MAHERDRDKHRAYVLQCLDEMRDEIESLREFANLREHAKIVTYAEIADRRK